MAKQTMGTPCLALKNRSDNKMYRIQTPQAPMIRTDQYNDYDMDKYPLGTNAVVCVLSYTVSIGTAPLPLVQIIIRYRNNLIMTLLGLKGNMK